MAKDGVGRVIAAASSPTAFVRKGAFDIAGDHNAAVIDGMDVPDHAGQRVCDGTCACLAVALESEEFGKATLLVLSRRGSR